MPWKTPDREDLAHIARAATESLHICSPFITRTGINILAEHLPNSLSRVEVWTKFDARDWITGASDPDGLLDFLEGLPAASQIDLRVSERLHAKFLVANGQVGVAGSANLTRGGFGGNIEIVRSISPAEISELTAYISSVRGELGVASLADLREFVSRCYDHTQEKEALLDLIREALPEPAPGTGKMPIRPISDFMDFLNTLTGPVVEVIRTIYFNQDGNNRTGHLKQGYYAVQRFFQEHPDYLAEVSHFQLDEPCNFREQPELHRAWLDFIQDSAEADSGFGYDFTVLKGYLTPNFGGRRVGGGGGDYPFRLVWTPVARMLNQQPNQEQ